MHSHGDRWEREKEAKNGLFWMLESASFLWRGIHPFLWTTSSVGEFQSVEGEGRGLFRIMGHIDKCTSAVFAENFHEHLMKPRTVGGVQTLTGFVKNKKGR